MISVFHYRFKNRKDIESTTKLLHDNLNPLLKVALYYTINKSIKSYEKSIIAKHEKKINNLKRTSTRKETSTNTYVKETVHNFSSYVLSSDERIALSYTLDQHIPTSNNSISIHSEFERFHQSLIRNLPHLPDEEKTRLKTKLRNTCDRYSRKSTPYKYRETIKSLANNPLIKVVKQDKGRGTVILDNNTYLEKCMTLLSTDQFTKLPEDPTRTTEAKIQKYVRNIKKCVPADVYSKIYPTGSSPGKFYGTAKIHKLKPEQNVNHLPLRPIISNINTPTYHLAKYLAKLLRPLGKSENQNIRSQALYTEMERQNSPNWLHTRIIRRRQPFHKCTTRHNHRYHPTPHLRQQRTPNQYHSSRPQTTPHSMHKTCPLHIQQRNIHTN